MLIELLSGTANISKSKLLSLSATASKRYKVYMIPKRSGGERKIEHPSREIKAIQRWIVKALISRFPVHEAATAYRKGMGIRKNAERHRGSKFTNRYDFHNFFPSFSQERVEAFVRQRATTFGIDLTEEDVEFVGNIVCRNGRLTIGAPSSPAITNAMMFEFDCAMFEKCSSSNLIYTRYADDIFVSSHGPGEMDHVGNLIVRTKREIEYLNLRLNHKKTAYLSRKYRRVVTGVVLTPQGSLSIGRHRKNEIKSLVYSWTKGELPEDKLYYLKGLLAFASDVEPAFKFRLEKKYGWDKIRLLQSSEDYHQAAILDDELY